ncbi:[NiFe]-hydrogenase assembly chaperone HybE [Diaphorobacter sp. HDW4A]|uniref:[NiFe]-hydrogenase assembly chaperone HybE n=1 Tax=Diaphorobacter sp. HDW4A TaxID=2714924 RepID=UPI00140A0DAF|nr:[NiFe]-hydrogenase assembly chaperone HybE [Diaphorobacter sp. HDW4A]QIL79449.1 [NiFe]-hydrogenase assembly chaperone HybE [Diaphorobacter sp. HDW4A]
MLEAMACATDNEHALQSRVAELQACFIHIAKSRMQGVALLNPSLRVRALGFQLMADETAAMGVLVTPWFMNLLCLPLVRSDEPQRVGEQRIRHLGGTDFAFLGMHEERGVGSFEACSLFSPMFEFQDAAAAEGTAQQVLALLRRPQLNAPAQESVSPGKWVPKSDSVTAQVAPTRRSFFFGRSSVGSGGNV